MRVSKSKTPLALIILDGFGYRAEREGNAIAQAEMPFYYELRDKYPHTLIEASGECVGLPKGVMGNSNVGHLSIGAGRVLRGDLERIQLHSSLLASAAPSDSAFSFAQAMRASTVVEAALVPKPQSTDAMTRSRPTALA